MSRASGSPSRFSTAGLQKASRPWVSAGAGWALLEKLSFNASYALQFERKKVRQISVGVKMQF